MDGVDTLVLDFPAVLTEIFEGTIKTWNDDKIAKQNQVSLPSDPITVFFRSDESGTTENTAKFLAAAGGWKDEPSKSWTGAGEGKNKSSGVAEAVTSTKTSTAYMEWSYAKDNNLKTAQLDNGKGAVELTADTVGAAASRTESRAPATTWP